MHALPSCRKLPCVMACKELAEVCVARYSVVTTCMTLPIPTPFGAEQVEARIFPHTVFLEKELVSQWH